MTTTLYKNTTQEQRKSMTPELRAFFNQLEIVNTASHKYAIRCAIKAYQQAQKAEIERLEIKQKTRRIFLGKDAERIKYKTGLSFIEAIIKDDDVTIAKLKFESELE